MGKYENILLLMLPMDTLQWQSLRETKGQKTQPGRRSRQSRGSAKRKKGGLKRPQAITGKICIFATFNGFWFFFS